MVDFNRIKQSQYKNMFFSLKLCALFFCVVPLFQFFFSGSASQTLYDINLTAMSISLGIMVLVMLLWFVLDSRRSKYPVVTLLEIIMFFLICTISIIISGGHTSNYKFLYLFLVVSYAIEYGIKTSVTIAGAAAFTLLTADLVMYTGGGVNPYFQSDLPLAALFLLLSWVVGFYVEMEERHIKSLEEYASLDGLTGIYNHRYFYDYFKDLCHQYKERLRSDLSLLMIDIDYFKNYNDIFGHQKGDSLLVALVRLMESELTGEQQIFRYGGDEFCVILPGTTQEKATEVAERLRQRIIDFEFPEREMMRDMLSISVGITQLSGLADTYLDMIERADRALYKAKYLRKNRVEVYSSIFDKFNDLEMRGDSSLSSVKLLITAINARDSYTFTHIERVVYFCELFANYLKLDGEDSRKLIYSAYLHDLGKIGVSKEVLIKETPLNDEEWEELKSHSVKSAEMITQIGGMDDIAEIALLHHERYDGKGYPSGKKGEEIPYLARILTVVDSFDAMTSKRPYKRSRSYEEAFEEISRCAGTQFDPGLAEAFINAVGGDISARPGKPRGLPV